jgi:hypothetical protein
VRVTAKAIKKGLVIKPPRRTWKKTDVKPVVKPVAKAPAKA